jgi:predicted acylesterase/phospholipase RssA
MKIAFVGSGGGLRAYAFHVGVLRALEENGFARQLANGDASRPAQHVISSYIGSSAGACAAAGAVFFPDIEAMEAGCGLHGLRHAVLGPQTLFRPDLGWLRPGRKLAGLFDAAGVEKRIRGRMGPNDFRRIVPEIYMCATQLNGPRKVVFGPRDSAVDGEYNRYIAYFNDVPISEALAASISVPVLFRPYRIRNRRSGEIIEYTDGEVRETLSLHVARDTDVDLAIVSNTWMPYSYTKRVGTISDRGVLAVLHQSLSQIIEQKIDRFRYETDRYRETFDAIRRFGEWEKLTHQQIENLIGQLSLTLNYRHVDEIYVTPDPDDHEFNFLPTFTYKKQVLRRAVDMGHRRATEAVRAWQARRVKPATEAAS